MIATMKPYTCPICGATFTEGTTERNLCLHVLKKHDLFVCAACSATFDSKAKRGAHLRWNCKAAFDVNCTKHGHSRSLSGDCGGCLKEAYEEAEANEGAHGLCGGCNNADWERSHVLLTWCTGWSKKGFPCHPRKNKCAKFTPRVDYMGGN